MKKVIIAIIASILLLSFATPVLADDPPDTDVDIGISTPGNVDLDVGINAGGDVNVKVDGVDFKGTAQIAGQANYAANLALNRTAGGFINTSDWYRYWNKEIVPYTELLVSHDSLLNLLTEAQAKLIKGQTLTESDVSRISLALLKFQAEIKVSQANTDEAIGSLKAQNDKTWNQLMYGAESHIDELQTTVDKQASKIVLLQSQLDRAEANVNLLYQNDLRLHNSIENIRTQYMYYIQILGGCMVLLLIFSICILAIRKNS